eukprot:210684-Prorocentrum_lima.AAC.1
MARRIRYHFGEMGWHINFKENDLDMFLDLQEKCTQVAQIAGERGADEYEEIEGFPHLPEWEADG